MGGNCGLIHFRDREGHSPGARGHHGIMHSTSVLLHAPGTKPLLRRRRELCGTLIGGLSVSLRAKQNPEASWVLLVSRTLRTQRTQDHKPRLGAWKTPTSRHRHSAADLRAPPRWQWQLWELGPQGRKGA